MFKFIFILTLLLTNLAAFARIHRSLPENNLWIPIDAKNVSSLDRATFYKILEKFNTIYGPIIASKGGQLQMEGFWEIGEVNAQTGRFDGKWAVQVMGGLGRHPLMTHDGFVAVICHEIGHQLGGAPISDMDWSSVEGQADYYSSLKCLREYFSDEDNRAEVNRMDVPDIVTQKCSAQFTDPSAIAICQRSSLAGLSISLVLTDLMEFSVAPDFATPDSNIVPALYPFHSSPQCRLDTIFQGALCPVGHKVDVSNTDPFVGTCKEGVGSRPLCWFAPTSKLPF